MIYYCRFCQLPCQRTPEYRNSPNPTAIYDSYIVYKCYKCSTKYLTIGEGYLRIMELYKRINNKLHKLELDYTNNISILSIIPDEIAKTIIMVASFDYILLSVNPGNFDNKIKTYVVFS